MDGTETQTAQEEWDALIALAALNGLNPDEEQTVRGLLTTHPDLRVRWQEYRRVADGLAHAVPLVQAPPRLELALRERLRAERRPAPQGRVIQFPVWQRWAAVAALLVVTLLGWQSYSLGQQTEALRVELAAARAEQQAVLTLLAQPELHYLPAVNLTTQQEVGAFIWASGMRTATFTVHGLPPTAPTQSYKLWVVRSDGTIDFFGTLDVSSEGEGQVFIPRPVVPWSNYTEFYLTLEPLEAPAPSTPPVVQGRF